MLTQMRSFFLGRVPRSSNNFALGSLNPLCRRIAAFNKYRDGKRTYVHNVERGPLQPAPGGNVPIKEKILGVGASALQNFAPIRQICQTVCGLHCYAHDRTRQVEAHHFCSHVSGDVRQCIIYDDNSPNARLIGVEYIISRQLFESLPPEEQRYWHSHKHEVQSGMLTAPGLPEAVELQEMQSLTDTYGKTWHLWQVDRGDSLPLGPAQLMSSFTKDGQINEGLLESIHGKFGYNTEAIRTARKSVSHSGPIQNELKYPESLPEGCDFPWHTGKSWQAKMEEGKFNQ